MEIGFLTAPLDKSLEDVVAFAERNGFQALEVAAAPGSRHLDPMTFTAEREKQINKALAGSGVRISSLAWYENLLEADDSARRQRLKEMQALIEAAAALKVDVVCTFGGMPLPGKDRMQTIEEDFAGVFMPLAEFGENRGVRIAFENWTETNFRNLGHWQRAFELAPHPSLGLNFDPSHLFWQGIDHLEAVDSFKDRIFHTHAKDTEVKQHVLRRLGNQEFGWWRYCIPGYGEIDWGVYIARLRGAGYDGVLSIENEDAAFEVEEAFIKGQRHLARYV